MSEVISEKPEKAGTKPPAVLLKEQMEQVAKLREEMAEMAEVIETTGATLIRRLDEPLLPEVIRDVEEILTLVRTPKVAPPKGGWRDLGLGVAVVVCVVGAWWMGRCPGEVTQRAAMLAHLHAVMVETYATLPPPVRGRIDGVYQHFGMQTPAKQGGK